jgi:hypothetical protein
VSKRTDTKKGTQLRIIMEHEELLEVTTKLPVKINYPVIDVGT